ncbi:MAG: hemerythrin domain-containing protein [Gammaproteobacteria bacterium]|nr:hemerythrin domain-containing protein [Gammaproteobacteria bacterium]
MQAISIIKREHRNLGAILFTLERLVQDTQKPGVTVDLKVFHGIIYYLDSFLDRFHHPKETEYLFPVVRTNAANAATVLDELEQQHIEGEQLLIEVLKALSAYEFLGENGFERFRDAVNCYVEFERNHAYTEEHEILPLAEKYLTPEDWLHIDEAFNDNNDPLFGSQPKNEFIDLHKTLTQLVPAPYGFGPELST